MIHQYFVTAAGLRQAGAFHHALGAEHGLMHRVRGGYAQQHHIGATGQVGGRTGRDNGGDFLRHQIMADYRIAKAAEAPGEGMPHEPEADETDDGFIFVHGNKSNAVNCRRNAAASVN